MPVEPGWYADPEPGAGGGQRWWDGGTWSEHRRIHPIPAYQGLLWALAGYAAGILVGGGLLADIGYRISGSETSALTTLLGQVGLWSGMLGSCLIVSRRYGTSSLRRDFTFAARPVDALVGVVAGGLGLAVTTLIELAFKGTSLSGTNTQVLTGQLHHEAGLIVVSLLVAIGAPFFEELFFRGLIRTSLSSRFGPIGAIWAQAALFGLAHFQPGQGTGNVSIVLGIGAFGVLLGYAAHYTRRLAAGMVGHGIFNTVATVLTIVR